MGFDSPILAIIMGLAAGASVLDTWRDRARLFDTTFTAGERQRMLRLALFVLLPFAVLMHEVGHAIAVKLFGGEITGFGFYMIYGYVAHMGYYTRLELGLIAFAGTFVNLIMGIAAFLWVWFRPFKGKPALNYLLFIFVALDLGNALIFYPVFDAMGGIAGDWGTIYSRDTPAFSLAVAVVHAAILIAAVIIWRNRGFQQGYAERTGLAHAGAQRPGGASARFVDGPADDRQLADELALATALAVEGWRHQVTVQKDQQAGGQQVVLRWESGGYLRALLVHVTSSASPDQHVELHGSMLAASRQGPPYQRSLMRIDGRPNATELAPYISQFLEFVDSWNGTNTTSPN